MIPIQDKEYRYITEFIYDYCKIALGDNKKELVTARLGKRLRHFNFTSFQQYIDFIQSPQGKEEIVNLVDAISTNHTFFFREMNHFDYLKAEVIPKIKPGKAFRVWSAACSSGEEPYTLAMLFDENIRGSWSIDASDISTKILAKAEEAIYPKDRFREMNADMIKKYFQKGTGKYEGFYRVKKELRDKIKFHHLNLFDNSYPFTGTFDTIFCRNVMIYFDRETQEKLVNRLASFLEPGGHLHIGNSESLTGIKHSLKSVKPAIYQKA